MVKIQLMLSFLFQILIELHQLQKTFSMKAGTEKYYYWGLHLSQRGLNGDSWSEHFQKVGLDSPENQDSQDIEIEISGICLNAAKCKLKSLNLKIWTKTEKAYLNCQKILKSFKNLGSFYQEISISIGLYCQEA
jgi:hypothetical protein